MIPPRRGLSIVMACYDVISIFRARRYQEELREWQRGKRAEVPLADMVASAATNSSAIGPAIAEDDDVIREAPALWSPGNAASSNTTLNPHPLANPEWVRGTGGPGGREAQTQPSTPPGEKKNPLARHTSA